MTEAVESKVGLSRWSGTSAYVRALPRQVRERMFVTAERLLGEDFSRRAKELNTCLNEAGYNPFGYDPEVGKYAIAFSALLYRYYFRVEVEGLENLPRGRQIIVANHSGQVPVDGLLLCSALALEASPPRLARSMVEKWSAVLPFVSVFFPRSGQVVGSPENAKRLLEFEETLVVFPEGVRGISKTFKDRYQMTDFSAGFMRLALQTESPIVPAAVIGTEEQYISVANFQRFARVLGVPSMPLMPQLFLGFVAPFPTKVRIRFGKPLRFSGDPDAEDRSVREKVQEVHKHVQGLVSEGLRARKAIFW